VDAYVSAGGDGPRYAQLTVCWAETEEEARETAFEWWPNAGLDGPLSQELPLPSHFEAAAEMVSADDVAETVVCGPDPERHVEGITRFLDAGFDHVYVHQVGSDQDGFFEFYESAVLPALAGLEAGARR
jgi:G6PDH family F420-dependent oxidoreductase